MKIIATAAVTLFAGLGRIAGCDAPPPEPAVAQTVTNPPTYQTSKYGNISMNAYASCAVFEATLTNTSGRTATWQFYADGSLARYVTLDSGHSETVDIYFPNNSGDHTVYVRWVGGRPTYRVWTNCS